MPIVPIDRTALSYLPERVEVTDAGLAILLNPNLKYALTHSGYDASGNPSAAVIDARFDQADPTEPEAYDPYSAEQNASQISPGGPSCVFGPVGSSINQNVVLVADTGESAMLLLTRLELPGRY